MNKDSLSCPGIAVNVLIYIRQVYEKKYLPGKVLQVVGFGLNSSYSLHYKRP